MFLFKKKRKVWTEVEKKVISENYSHPSLPLNTIMPLKDVNASPRLIYDFIRTQNKVSEIVIQY